METFFNFVLTSFIFIFGASVGSFLNVVIYRVPAELSLLYPPSRCPKCLHQLGKTENIPVLGWLRLGGKCRWCKNPISARYPIVEAVCSILFCLVFWQFTFSWTTLGYWVLVSWLLVLGLIDFDTMTLPNVLTQSGLVLGLLYQILLGWQNGNLIQGLMLGIGSAVLGLWLFDIIRFSGEIALGQPAMGGGDPKLAAMIGAWLGWQALLVTAFLACILGSIGGVFAMFLGRLNRGQPMPFGPYLALGAVLTIFWGSTMIATYKSLFFPLL
jgi:leader peptidase (prepilin peptidase)/N-methyltransferase